MDVVKTHSINALVVARDLAWHDLAFYNVDLYEGMRRMMLDAQEGNKGKDEFLSTYCCYFEVGIKKERLLCVQ